MTPSNNNPDIQVQPSANVLLTQISLMSHRNRQHTKGSRNNPINDQESQKFTLSSADEASEEERNIDPQFDLKLVSTTINLMSYS